MLASCDVLVQISSVRTDGTRSVLVLLFRAGYQCSYSLPHGLEPEAGSKYWYWTQLKRVLPNTSIHHSVRSTYRTSLVCLNSTRRKTLFGQAPNLPDYGYPTPQKSTLTAENPIIAISYPAAGASRSTWCHVQGRVGGVAIAPVRGKLSIRRVDMLMDQRNSAAKYGGLKCAFFFFSWHFHSDVVASKKAVGDFPNQARYVVTLTGH